MLHIKHCLVPGAQQAFSKGEVMLMASVIPSPLGVQLPGLECGGWGLVCLSLRVLQFRVFLFVCRKDVNLPLLACRAG